MVEQSALTAAQQKLREISETPHLKMVEPAKPRDAQAPDAPKKQPAKSVAYDVEDMWDNMPV